MADRRQVAYVRPPARRSGPFTGFERFVAECSDQVYGKHRRYFDSIRNPASALHEVLKDEWLALPDGVFRYYCTDEDAAGRAADAICQANREAIDRIASALRALKGKTDLYSHVKSFDGTEALITSIVHAELKRARDRVGAGAPAPLPPAKRRRPLEPE